MKISTHILILMAFVCLVFSWQSKQSVTQNRELTVNLVVDRDESSVDRFMALIDDERSERRGAITEIEKYWDGNDVPLLLEILVFVQDPEIRSEIVRVLSERTGQAFGDDLNQWYRWSWNRDFDRDPSYATFKRLLYARIDPRFTEYFDEARISSIRLDEIRWGGVRRDGIPPLKNPETIPANDATYLADSDVVFGVHLGGKARAYPKRILAWHEMVKDVVGGVSINGVYCTLCGSMIIYQPDHNGKHYELGTSGFLYRSNKLMYDHETKSLWSTLEGKPVVGPLVGNGIELESLSVVTTTWGHWKKLHPTTDVLSLRTGHRRDYGEGVAYQKYFATDDLMFIVPKTDPRLKNKDEVLVVRGDHSSIALSAAFLKANRVYHLECDDQRLVVLTDDTYANRVYKCDDVQFEAWDGSTIIKSLDGVQWLVSESALTQHLNDSQVLVRAASHRAFWFGWYSAFPGTKLIQ